MYYDPSMIVFCTSRAYTSQEWSGIRGACLEQRYDLEVSATKVFLKHLSVQVTIVWDHVPYGRDGGVPPHVKEL